eukprot:m.125676 g.125676  ORF g.125676 m.125676 type:complete len:682 (-) comp11174_c0_seq2:1096-3141(-)
MDFTRCVNTSWRMLPKNEEGRISQSDVESLCLSSGVTQDKLDEIWTCAKATESVDFAKLELILGLVSLVQQNLAVAASGVHPTMTPPLLAGVHHGNGGPGGDSSVLPATFGANPNPWSAWTMALDWPPPSFNPPPVVFDKRLAAEMDTRPDPTPVAPTVDHAKWLWDAALLQAPPPAIETDAGGDDSNGADDEVPVFAEPDFPRTGIPEVDDKIREGIMEKLRSEWELGRAERAANQGRQLERTAAIARARREDAVASVTTEANAALAETDPLAKVRRLNVAVAAARRLEPLLEPDLSLTSRVAEWDEELARVEAECFGQPGGDIGGDASVLVMESVSPGGTHTVVTTDGAGAATGPSTCANCSGEVAADDKFCPNCGTPVQAQKVAVKTDEWEIERSRIKVIKNIGAGEFGEVQYAVMDGKVEVAVKTAKKQVRAFLAEAGKMKKLKHRNIVELLGVCTVGEPALIVLEFARSGAVLDFLHKNYRKFGIRLQCSMCADVAAGLAYLLKTHWIHGDLAARNLLVGGQIENIGSLVIKICDFGHAMQTDEFNTPVLVSRQLALRWIAPELYEFRRSSPETDVWSFGVVVYEILSSGRTPYADIENNKDVMNKIMNGWRMPREKYIWKPFYDMMLACWDKDPAKRPKPQQLYECCKKWQNAPNLTVSRTGALQYNGGTLKFEY